MFTWHSPRAFQEKSPRWVPFFLVVSLPPPFLSFFLQVPPALSSVPPHPVFLFFFLLAWDSSPCTSPSRCCGEGSSQGWEAADTPPPPRGVPPAPAPAAWRWTTSSIASQKRCWRKWEAGRACTCPICAVLLCVSFCSFSFCFWCLLLARSHGSCSQTRRKVPAGCGRVEV